jgi:peptidoglycan/LPS O-acetylase OafA/YrhL
MVTFGSRLADHKGIGPGFDTVRLVLALSVVFIHCSLLRVPSPEIALEPILPMVPLQRWAFDFVPVPMFFALSGFLVAASAERLSLGQFLVNRSLRIFPALGFQVVFAMLVLGPLLTSLPLAQYWSDPLLARYALNIVGSIHYELPGLFLGNPEPGIVNGSLWTVPHEISCYLLLGACVLVGLFRHRFLMLLTTLVLFGMAIGIYLCDSAGITLPLHDKLTYLFVTRGAARLAPLFISGIVLYQYRDRIPYRLSYAALGAVGYVVLAAFGSPGWIANPIFTFLTAPVFAYGVVYAGLSSALVIGPLKKADYSYGIYLAGFPLQQALIQLMPWLKNPAVFFALSAAAAGTIAAISWHLVEKPILKLRRKFSVAARIHTAAEPAVATAPPGRHALTAAE